MLDVRKVLLQRAVYSLGQFYVATVMGFATLREVQVLLYEPGSGLTFSAFASRQVTPRTEVNRVRRLTASSYSLQLGGVTLILTLITSQGFFSNELHHKYMLATLSTNTQLPLTFNQTREENLTLTVYDLRTQAKSMYKYSLAKVAYVYYVRLRREELWDGKWVITDKHLLGMSSHLLNWVCSCLQKKQSLKSLPIFKNMHKQIQLFYHPKA